MNERITEYPRTENWSRPGMPPRFVDVVGRETLTDAGTFKRERVWIRGAHPHLGKLHPRGWSGFETIVEREIISPLTTFKVIKRS